MSAYDWKECPMCKKKHETKLRKLKKLYGKITPEEYEDKRKEILEEKDYDEEEQTVRHDQEAWLNDNGELEFYISMGCQSCGAQWDAKDKIKPKIYEDDE